MDLFAKEHDNKERKFEKIQLRNGEVLVMRNFIKYESSLNYLDVLARNINWRQEEIKLYGKVYPVPRKTAWYGYPGLNYSYSGIKCNPEPWTAELMEIKKDIESLHPGEDFNSVLLNMYRDGNDKVSWHSDDEKELGKNPTIASVSLGASRRFDLKHKDDPNERLEIELTSGSLIIMKGELQHFWLHQIPQQKKIANPRINLTYRTIKL
jgi:alkylated DNA repair dioxygenase AlkB